MLKDLLTKKRGANYDTNDESYWSYAFSDGSTIMPEIESGKKHMYIYWAELYKDKSIPPDTYMVTEHCSFIMPTHALGRCSSHNGRLLIR